MKVGIYLGWGPLQPEAGGGHTFQQSLLQVLTSVPTQHEFYIFYYGEKPVDIFHTKHIFFVPIFQWQKILWLKPYSWFKKILIKRKFKTLLNKAVLDNQIDLIWFMTPGYEFVKIPYLYTIWDLQHRKQSFFPEVSVEQNQFEGREKLYASVIPRAAYVLTGNETAKKEVVDFYRVPAERVKMLELPTPEFALQQSIMHKSITSIQNPYFFYPAQFWPHKNHMVILRALALLKNNIDVVFTGSDKGNLAYVQEQALSLGVINRVHFLGFVSREELISLYQHTVALVFPSFFGPNNIPPLEAFALGCPVICADADGMREQLGDAALFFNPTDEHDLMQKITLILENSQKRNDFIAAGKERALQWTSRDYVQEVVSIIDEFSAIRRCWGDQRAYVRR